jgi:hypothetical protein
MPVLKPRKRLVYFRLSEDEFQRISGLCESSGARSISELVRSAVEQFAGAAPAEEAALDCRLRDLERILSELNERVRQLTCALHVGGAQNNREVIVDLL